MQGARRHTPHPTSLTLEEHDLGRPETEQPKGRGLHTYIARARASAHLMRALAITYLGFRWTKSAHSRALLSSFSHAPRCSRGVYFDLSKSLAPLLKLSPPITAKPPEALASANLGVTMSKGSPRKRGAAPPHGGRIGQGGVHSRRPFSTRAPEIPCPPPKKKRKLRDPLANSRLRPAHTVLLLGVPQEHVWQLWDGRNLKIQGRFWEARGVNSGLNRNMAGFPKLSNDEWQLIPSNRKWRHTLGAVFSLPLFWMVLVKVPNPSISPPPFT